MITNLVLLQEGGGGGMSLLMIIAIFAIMWFMMIAPQRKQQKMISNFQKNLSAGDKVVTAGGLIAKVRKVSDATLEIEIAKNVSVTIGRDKVFPYADPKADPKKGSDKKDDKKDDKKKIDAEKPEVEDVEAVEEEKK